MIVTNILGTLDHKIENCQKRKDAISNFAWLLYNKISQTAQTMKPLSAIAPVLTGKEDANFSSVDGKFPFFTCGRDILYCSTPAFNGKAILIAGNGDFNVKHYNGAFNAYQRTYVIIPENEINYALLYFASLLAIKKLVRRSAGSIIKFITKTDIEEILVPQDVDNNLLKEIDICIGQIDLLNQEIKQIMNVKNNLLPLLMNSQVQVMN